MMKYIVFILVINLLAVDLFAYDSAKCTRFRDKTGGWAHGTLLFSSTSSYISSTGDCSAIAYHSKENKEKYYAQNRAELQFDIAKGGGPYLAELSSLYGCENQKQVAVKLTKNYSTIYENKRPQLKIEKLLQNQNCIYL